DESSRCIQVQLETIDEVLGATPVDVMKLDVEGGELQVIYGARRTLRAGVRHIVFEEHRGPGSDAMRYLESIGYTIFAIGWSIRGPKLGPLSGARLAAPYESPNYVATLAPDDVQRRCARSGWLTLSRRFAKSANRQPC